MESEEVETSSSNSDTDNDNSDTENESNIGHNTNAGWADSIAKILKTKKPKGKKTLVLSKGKKICLKKEEVSKVNFEIETVDGEVKEETYKISENESTILRKRIKKRELRILCVKPNILNKDRERTLCKVATKGVVQLYNAIKSQQSDINKKLSEAGSMEVKRNKVLKNVDKRTFLDILMGEDSSVSQKEKVKVKEKKKSEKKEKQWNVLQDDFMMGAKLKDWDLLENENEEEMEYS